MCTICSLNETPILYIGFCSRAAMIKNGYAAAVRPAQIQQHGQKGQRGVLVFAGRMKIFKFSCKIRKSEKCKKRL